jgi:hypothetical protein
MSRTKVIASKGGGASVALTDAEEIIRDAEEKAWADGQPKRDAMGEIKRLENTITARRLREALATAKGKTWVASVETLIAVERGKL